MSEKNNAICEICQKVLGGGEVQSQHCVLWCIETSANEEVESTKKHDE